LSTRRAREKALRRELVLQAAERVFGRRPFHEATMLMVATEADLGMQSLYEQFPSKQTLYETVILHRARTFQVRLEEALASLTDPLDQLTAVARVRARMFTEAPAFLPVFLAERVRCNWGVRSRSSRRIGGVMREATHRLQGIIERAVADGSLRREEPDFLVHLFNDTLTAALYAHRNHPREDIETCIQRAIRAFLHGTAAAS
jgi:TetR/AcrR family transcriptional regulator